MLHKINKFIVLVAFAAIETSFEMTKKDELRFLENVERTDLLIQASKTHAFSQPTS